VIMDIDFHTILLLLLFQPLAVLRFIRHQMGQKLNKRRMHVKAKGHWGKPLLPLFSQRRTRKAQEIYPL
jgi:hypothetical protein